jgi:hypothetical protein
VLNARRFVRHTSEIDETGAAETVCRLEVCRESSQRARPRRSPGSRRQSVRILCDHAHDPGRARSELVGGIGGVTAGRADWSRLAHVSGIICHAEITYRSRWLRRAGITLMLLLSSPKAAPFGIGRIFYTAPIARILHREAVYAPISILIHMC